jgi:spore germination protein GerM
MNKRMIQGMLLASAVLLAATGCAQKKQSLTGQPEATETPVVQSPKPTATPAPELKQSKVKLYYSDDNESKLIEKESTVSYKADKDKFAATLQALKKGDDPKLVSLFADIVFKEVTFSPDKGELKLNLEFGPNAQFGAPGEDLFLQALKKTAFQFPEVNAIYVLKNGKKEESLMGHMELPYPIRRVN